MFSIGGTGCPNFDGSFGRIAFDIVQITILGTESIGVVVSPVDLKFLSSEVNHQVTCAVFFMKQPRRLLEAHGGQWYREMPVTEECHESYVSGDSNTQQYYDFVDE
jgi:hypothetical protein